MTENDPKPTTLIALLLATVALPPLVAATVLRGEPEAPKPHAAFCSDVGAAASASASVPARTASPAHEAPLLACGPVANAVTP